MRHLDLDRRNRLVSAESRGTVSESMKKRTGSRYDYMSRRVHKEKVVSGDGTGLYATTGTSTFVWADGNLISGLNNQTTGNSTTNFYTWDLDAETGLYYYGHRYYDSVNGRWPSRDPIGEAGGDNSYIFIRNDVIGSLEMLGMCLLRETRTLEFPVYHWKNDEGGYLLDKVGSPRYETLKIDGTVIVEGQDLFVPQDASYSVTIVLDRTQYTDEWEKKLKDLEWGAGHRRYSLAGIFNYKDSRVRKLSTKYEPLPLDPKKKNEPDENYDDHGLFYVKDSVAEARGLPYGVRWIEESNDRIVSPPVRMAVNKCPNQGKSDIWVWYADLKNFGGASWGHFEFNWNYDEDMKIEISQFDGKGGEQVPPDLAKLFGARPQGPWKPSPGLSASTPRP